MLARTHSVGVLGIDGYVVTVESDIGPGLPGLTIVGQVHGPLYEAGARVRAALDCCGFALPKCMQIVNVEPAEQRKDCTGVDLAIACALLVSHGVIPAASLAGVMLWGELAADGSIRPPLGTLIAAETALRNGFRVLMLPPACARETALIAGLDLLLAPNLPQLIAHLRGETSLPCGVVQGRDLDPPPARTDGDFADVREPLARLALEVMVAGDHHLAVYGPCGSGTALALQVAGLLNEVDDDDALGLTKIQATHSRTSRLRVPQIRKPSPRISMAQLLGGGRPPRPGEVSLAHRGVLVLDELHEFSEESLRGIFWAMADGSVTVGTGASQLVRFPAGFRVLAMMRPCPCGWLGHVDRVCEDRPATVRRFLARIPGWILDRMDLVVPLNSAASATTIPSLADARQRIALAKLRQHERVAGTPWQSNGEIPTSGTALEQLLPLTPAAAHFLAAAGDELGLRDRRRLCRVARTLADLDPGRDPAAPLDADVLTLASSLRTFSGQSVRRAL